jgi:hypothetical protein
MSQSPRRGHQKAPLAPDTSHLDERSALAWTEAMAVEHVDDAEYVVEGASGTRYVVDLGESSCTCPDHELRQERCNHLRRVAIEINRGMVPPPGRVEATCTACGDHAFVDPGTSIPLCLSCHVDPGDTVRDRETGDVLVVAAVCPETADTVEVANGVTVAAYDNNEGYPADDPVVEAVYPFSGEASQSLEEQRRYEFPLSRLQRR